MKGLQTYKLEFGDDGKTYFITFEGRLSPEDIRGILEALHSRLYKDYAGIIRSYMEQRRLEYFHFETGELLLNHDTVMNRAEELLRSRSYESVGSPIGNVDNYYAVMDYQRQFDGGFCEGCYYAVRRTADRGIYYYRIIGQTFFCDGCGDNPRGYFAIRANNKNRRLRSLDKSDKELVLPSFGCVDMMRVLMDIDKISASGQVKEAAVK